MSVSIAIFASPGELAVDAAHRISRVLHEAVLERGSAVIALSGGTTPKAIYELLATPAFRGRLEWNKVHMFFGDERCVPPDHRESNYRMVREALLERASIQTLNIHRIHAELPPSEAAKRYEKEVATYFDGGHPRFDLVMLGMGEDGHTASLFPGTAVLNENRRMVAETFVPQLNTSRITLTFPAINHSRTVLCLVTGKGKAPVLREVLEERPGKYPVERVAPGQGDLLWYLDKEAASQLTKERI